MPNIPAWFIAALILAATIGLTQVKAIPVFYRIALAFPNLFLALVYTAIEIVPLDIGLARFSARWAWTVLYGSILLCELYYFLMRMKKS